MSRDFQALQSKTYDLVVIGAGVNGAAVARDGSLRGLRTLLLDKGDFGGGTSSWSTRLVHGGLRYLETFEIDLVRESLREREILLKTAPHLVKPLALTIPTYDHSRRSLWEIRAGMVLYDLLSFDKSLPNHRILSAPACQRLYPGLDPDGLRGAAQYYDAQVIHAERLCLETVLAAQRAGATVMNYAEVVGWQRSETTITAMQVRDQVTGSLVELGSLANAVVVNTAGPWVDAVLQRGQGSRPFAPLIGGTKGSHILVDRFVGAPEGALYVEARSDGRPFFIVPWHQQRFLIGTTDLPFAGDLDQVKASDEEIDYLIQETNRILPTARLSRSSVRFTYSGVRPLPASEGKSAGQITRRHLLHDHKADGIHNCVSLVGGKLTTFRQVGAELVEWVYRRLGRTAPPCPTLNLAFPGSLSPQDPRILEAISTYSHRVSTDSLDHLFGLYGCRAGEVLALVDQEPTLGDKLDPACPDIKAQVVFAVQAEMAQTLVDILLRRTTLGIDRHYGLESAPAICRILEQQRLWDTDGCQRQIEDYQRYIHSHCMPDWARSQEA